LIQNGITDLTSIMEITTENPLISILNLIFQYNPPVTATHLFHINCKILKSPSRKVNILCFEPNRNGTFHFIIAGEFLPHQQETELWWYEIWIEWCMVEILT